jgi:DNA-binding MarR family transcriptional regulator
MAPQRLSRLQRRILRCLLAEYRRTNGGTSLGHVDLVKALEGDQGTISHSLRTLETRGLITIGRTSGGQASSVDLPSEGRKVAFNLSKICG